MVGQLAMAIPRYATLRAVKTRKSAQRKDLRQVAVLNFSHMTIQPHNFGPWGTNGMEEGKR